MRIDEPGSAGGSRLAASDVRDKAIRHIARVFGKPPSSIALSDRFGYELKATFVSDFKRNEYDVISNAVHDVAAKDALREISAGRIVIDTVGDYCEHMVKCAAVQPLEVALALGMTEVDVDAEV